MLDWFGSGMSSPAERWRRWALPRLLMTEAIAYLILARMALSFFSFPRLAQFFERPVRRPELAGDARRGACRQVCSAIYRVHRRWPGLTTCFHRAIAAQVMLRRRGVGATLCYGAATLPDRGLITHAWVQDGDEGVVGHITARMDRYRILACYPKSSSRVPSPEGKW